MIHNENCLDTMARMAPGSIDLVVTSPPYDNMREYGGHSAFDFDKIAAALFRVITEGGVVVWIVGDQAVEGAESGTSFRQALGFIEHGFNLVDTMIYEKPVRAAAGSNRTYYQVFEFMFVLSKGKHKTANLIKGRKNKGRTKQALPRNPDGTKRMEKCMVPVEEFGRLSNIWYVPAGGNNGTMDKAAYRHPATFPERLARDHILSWSNKWDTVYDPFSGSGTTCKMARALERRWIGSEINPEYHKVALERLRLDQAPMEAYSC